MGHRTFNEIYDKQADILGIKPRLFALIINLKAQNGHFVLKSDFKSILLENDFHGSLVKRFITGFTKLHLYHSYIGQISYIDISSLRLRENDMVVDILYNEMFDFGYVQRNQLESLKPKK